VAEQGAAEWHSTPEKTYGEKAADAIINYEATLPIRAVAEQFQARLSAVDTPLTDAQVESVIAILANSAHNEKGKVNYRAINQARHRATPSAIAFVSRSACRAKKHAGGYPLMISQKENGSRF
jgi:hypothetical protein